MTQDESALLRRALAGVPGGADALVGHIDPVLRRQAWGVLSRFGCAHEGDPAQELDGVVQQLWTVLLARDQKLLRAWDPARANLRTWVGRIARLQTLSLLEVKRSNPWTDVPMAPADLTLVADPVDPERQAAARELLGRALTLLEAELTPRTRPFVQLLLVEQLSTADAVAQTGRSAGTIDNTCSKLRNRLRGIARTLADGGRP
ncbi:MAG: DNA-directed RNA polymerase specialized sigma24 family protein [Myxococcota bacterium]|jgi:DNA-directed RNA polymerase specialized sigma24 family protein